VSQNINVNRAQFAVHVYGSTEALPQHHPALVRSAEVRGVTRTSQGVQGGRWQVKRSHSGGNAAAPRLALRPRAQRVATPRFGMAGRPVSMLPRTKNIVPHHNGSAR
jgi:hypothetical protein